MANDKIIGSKGLAAPPPRIVNVQKFAESRASELETLYSIVANRVNDDFRSRRNKRRRTTGYDNRGVKNRHRKKQKLGVGGENSSLASEKDQKNVPRRIRRRVELKKNPLAGYCTSGDGTKRLRTHVWHAKRFRMTKLWGFHLPLGLQGRGKGSRSLLKRYKHGALIHDASYCSAVQLEGPEDLLLSILSMVLVPSPSTCCEDTSSILSGAIYGSAILHHVGGPFSRTIAPVMYVWRPSFRCSMSMDTDNCKLDGSNEPWRIKLCSSFRQLWVWLHASVFNEGYDILKFACQKRMDETGIQINCFSLEGQLAKFEVMGLKASQLLQRILHPINCASDNCLQLKTCTVEEAGVQSELKESLNLENEDHLSSHAVISLTVNDPRDLPKRSASVILGRTSTNHLGDTPKNEAKEHTALAGSVLVVPGETSTDCLGVVPKNEAKEHIALQGSLNKDNSSLSSSRLKFKSYSILSDAQELWDACNGISPPVEENVMLMERHNRRLESFCLSHANSGMLISSTETQNSRSCPILLLKNNDRNSSLMSWSIILPLSWAKSFWVPLVANGAQAIGLTEKHWIASEVGLPFFPVDFPDCDAYSCFMANEANASDEKLKLRPASIRPFRVPIPPPWDSVQYAFKKEFICEDGIHQCEKVCSGVDRSSSTNSNSRPSFGHCISFKGFVARTVDMLLQFLNKIHGDHLLLFPKFPDRKTSLFRCMKNEEKLFQGSNEATRIIYEGKSCFLRVLLYAFKEGVFEEGAVVCAPDLSDIPSSAGDYNGVLQIPESSVRSYFKEQCSGKWTIEIPEDPVTKASHRWPIGFVTTGFVRGSKKPVAAALCEATLLARLREEQWNKTPVKRRRKEIYVLVRNLRSTAYRLALATIVLEQQERDVEFM